jgi:hypothetical protein
MDETEVSNSHYREFEYWTKRVFGETYPQEVLSILPDTLVWREELAFNEPWWKPISGTLATLIIQS